jgi:hypothetical protein
LADVLDRLKQDAGEEDSKLARALREATETNPPDGIAKQMERAAQALKDGKPGEAKKDVETSAQQLQSLAHQLDAARRAHMQPQLEKYLAAERQAAQTNKALHEVSNESQKASAEKSLSDLRDQLDALKPGEGKLADAAAKLNEAATKPSAGWSLGSAGKTPRGFYNVPTDYETSVQAVIEALQTKIQELILKDALLDKDENVPPQYRKLVEQYYRVLSEDLR